MTKRRALAGRTTAVPPGSAVRLKSRLARYRDNFRLAIACLRELQREASNPQELRLRLGASAHPQPSTADALRLLAKLRGHFLRRPSACIAAITCGRAAIRS